MSRMPVWTRDAAFAAAMAQLPERLERAARPRGAICVVDGSRDGLDDVRSLIAARPAAAVLAHPHRAEASVVELLAAVEVPVVVDRPLLRPDVAGRASDPGLRHVVVEVVSSSADLRAVLADGVGWARAVIGHPLRVVAATRTTTALLAALEGPAGTTATIGGTIQSTSLPPALELQGLGARRLEVEIDAVRGIRSRVHDAEGFTERATRYEAHERLALRRALDASSAAGPSLSEVEVADVGDLAHDLAVADSLLDRRLE